MELDGHCRVTGIYGHYKDACVPCGIDPSHQIPVYEDFLRQRYRSNAQERIDAAHPSALAALKGLIQDYNDLPLEDRTPELLEEFDQKFDSIFLKLNGFYVKFEDDGVVVDTVPIETAKIALGYFQYAKDETNKRLIQFYVKTGDSVVQIPTESLEGLIPDQPDLDIVIRNLAIEGYFQLDHFSLGVTV